MASVVDRFFTACCDRPSRRSADVDALYSSLLLLYCHWFLSGFAVLILGARTRKITNFVVWSVIYMYEFTTAASAVQSSIYSRWEKLHFNHTELIWKKFLHICYIQCDLEIESRKVHIYITFFFLHSVLDGVPHNRGKKATKPHNLAIITASKKKSKFWQPSPCTLHATLCYKRIVNSSRIKCGFVVCQQLSIIQYFTD